MEKEELLKQKDVEISDIKVSGQFCIMSLIKHTDTFI